MKETRKNKAFGFYITVAAAILGIVALILYFYYASLLGTRDYLVVAGIIVGVVCGLVQLYLRFGIFSLVMSAVYSVTLFYFITSTETIGSYTDYFNNIVAFGHSELLMNINMVIGVLGVAALLTIVGCFLSISKEEAGFHSAEM